MFDVTSCWVALWRLYRHATCLQRLLPRHAQHRRRDLSVNSEPGATLGRRWRRPWANLAAIAAPNLKPRVFKYTHRRCLCAFASLLYLATRRNCIQRFQPEDHWRPQPRGTEVRASWTLRVYTSLAIFTYTYLQWALVHGLGLNTTHVPVPATEQIHSRCCILRQCSFPDLYLRRNLCDFCPISRTCTPVRAPPGSKS